MTAKRISQPFALRPVVGRPGPGSLAFPAASIYIQGRAVSVAAKDTTLSGPAEGRLLMKHLPKFPIVVICLVPLTLAACSQQAQQPQQPQLPQGPQPVVEPASNTQADVEALKEWIDRYCATVTAGDLEGYRAFWTEDVVWLPPHEPALEGIEACMGRNGPYFEQYDLVETMSVEEVEVADRFAYVRVNYQFHATAKADAEPVEEDGKGVFILRRQPDGSWVSTHCVWNFNTPAPEEASE